MIAEVGPARHLLSLAAFPGRSRPAERWCNAGLRTVAPPIHPHERATMNTKPLASIVPAIGLMLAACTTVATIPHVLEPGADASLAMVVPAKGVQIYECRARTGAQAAYEWHFIAPDAELFDTRGNRIGQHGAGPFWQAADGSRVVASVKTRANAPEARDIPWLLLTAKNDGPAGAFSAVTSIQRVNTVGGIAPAGGCDANTLGQRARVAYTADYRFFTSSKGAQHATR